MRSPAEGGAHRISADLYGFRWRIASEVSLLSGLIPCCLHSLFFSYHFFVATRLLIFFSSDFISFVNYLPVTFINIQFLLCLSNCL